MILGIDAGGTKTDLCLCTDNGHIVLRTFGEGVNAARLGAPRAADALIRQLSQIPLAGVRALYVGMAGAGSEPLRTQLEALLRKSLPAVDRLCVRSDAFNALNGEVGSGDGVALIAGTGSSAFLRKNGSVRQVGGRGYLIDDAGSGYWVGRAALNAAFRSLDGRGAPTALAAACEERLGLPLPESIPSLYEKGPTFVASFAPLVFACAEAGDAVSQTIAKNCARELALHLRACAEAAFPHPSAADASRLVCVLSGSLFRSDLLKRLLAEEAAPLPLDLRVARLPSVYGAVVSAAELANLPADETFRTNFTQSLPTEE